MRLFALMIMMMLAGQVQAATLTDVEAAVMEKNYADAGQMAAEVLKENKDHKTRAQAEYYLGLSQLRQGQYAQSRKSFRITMQATDSTELYDKAALGLMEGLYMADHFKDALKEGEALLRKHPDSPAKSLIYLKIARANLKLMQWPKARDYLQKIITEFPESFEAPIAQGLLEEKEYFTVQVGSFLDRAKAFALADELKAKGQYAYIVETDANGKTFCRVRVGQMASLADAKDLQAQLSTQGYPALIYP